MTKIPLSLRISSASRAQRSRGGSLHGLVAPAVARHAKHFATSGTEPLYLYFRRSVPPKPLVPKRGWYSPPARLAPEPELSLRLATDAPDGFEIAEPRCYSGVLSIDTVYLRIAHRAISLRHVKGRRPGKPQVLPSRTHYTVKIRLQPAPLTV